MEKKKQISLLVLGLFITIGMVVGVTYALWQVTLQQTEKNVITTGCFDVTLEEGDAITLNNAYPMTDAEGVALTPYTFTIKNNCAEKASYVLNLETVSSGEKILSDEYVKASLKNNDSELFLSTLDSTKENLEKVIDTASKAYKLTEGVLNAKEEKTFELRLWMDESTPTIDEVMNASYMGKITVTSSYVPYVEPNILISMEFGAIQWPYLGNAWGNLQYTQVGKYKNLTKVVFENSLLPYEEAVEVVDFSAAQDGSIRGYYVEVEDNNPIVAAETKSYELHIQANGKIKANKKTSYLFTSWYADASSDGMFYGTSTFEGLENLDFTNVTDMSYMYAYYTGSTLEIPNIDTSKVTNMSSMFADASSLSTITYGDNFIHKENADITNMFYNCPANKPTHSSWNAVAW